MRGIRYAAGLLALFVGWATHPAMGQETMDPDNDGSQYAWGENVGWINAEPEGDGGSGLRFQIPSITGWLWGENIGWISLSCANTDSCAAAEYGVVSDEQGFLSGFAWAENVGWISFSCASTATCGTVGYGVSVDLATGEFSGFAWGENVGWISFSCESTSSCGSVSWRVKTSVPVGDDHIFSDGFESGGLASWSHYQG